MKIFEAQFKLIYKATKAITAYHFYFYGVTFTVNFSSLFNRVLAVYPIKRVAATLIRITIVREPIVIICLY